jgi:hypothetical protein
MKNEDNYELCEPDWEGLFLHAKDIVGKRLKEGEQQYVKNCLDQALHLLREKERSALRIDIPYVGGQECG